MKRKVAEVDDVVVVVHNADNHEGVTPDEVLSCWNDNGTSVDEVRSVVCVVMVL